MNISKSTIIELQDALGDISYVLGNAYIAGQDLEQYAPQVEVAKALEVIIEHYQQHHWEADPTAPLGSYENPAPAILDPVELFTERVVREANEAAAVAAEEERAAERDRRAIVALSKMDPKTLTEKQKAKLEGGRHLLADLAENPLPEVVPATPKTRKPGTKRYVMMTRRDRDKVRAWGVERGLTGPSGRLARACVVAYNEANGTRYAP